MEVSNLNGVRGHHRCRKQSDAVCDALLSVVDAENPCKIPAQLPQQMLLHGGYIRATVNCDADMPAAEVLEMPDVNGMRQGRLADAAHAVQPENLRPNNTTTRQSNALQCDALTGWPNHRDDCPTNGLSPLNFFDV